MSRDPLKYEVKSVIQRPRAEVWDILCNTDRINRVIGLSAVDFDPNPTGGSAPVREMRTKFAGLIPMRWQEHPFTWVKEERYAVLRTYDIGPLARFVGGVELQDTSHDGSPATKVRLLAEFVPANVFGSLLIPFIARRTLNRTLKYCEESLQAGHTNRAFAPTVSSYQSPTDAQHLTHALDTLEQAPLRPEYVRRLAEYIRQQTDEEVAAIQPFRLAELWNVPRQEILRTCLYATKAGLLNLSWSLMCPNCRVPVNKIPTLGNLTEHIHCDFCGVTYDADFDRYVELRFTVHPAIRAAAPKAYCIGGPFLAPHVLVRQAVPQGDEVTVEFPATTDELSLRILRSPHRIRFADDQAGQPRAERFSFSDEGWIPNCACRPEAGTKLQFANTSSGNIVFDLEKVEWDPYAATALQVTALQEFRDMFSSEVLAPGQHIGVENLTLFFSDLRGSTDLYEKVGDAPAYGCVRRHFDYLFERIGDCNGSIVKTIGDAVMAVFQTPADAMRASLAIQRDVRELNSRLPDDADIIIKIGLHHGPAICVNSNDRLDYFGRTVNIAARTTGNCRGGDIVLTEAVYHHAGVQPQLAQQDVLINPFEAELKGIEGSYQLFRVAIASESAT